MSRLFSESEMSDKMEIPYGILDVELTAEEAVVLKTMVFIGELFSKNEMTRTVKSVLASVAAYANISKRLIDVSFYSLENKGLVGQFDGVYGVDKKTSRLIRPLVKDNLLLFKAIEKRNTYFGYNTERVSIPMAILTNDFNALNKQLYVSEPYFYKSAPDVIRKALIDLGDFTLINPLPSRFNEQQHDFFLNTLPLFLDYNSFSQLKGVYLDDTVKCNSYAKYVYASCAQLVLPVDEAVEIVSALKLESSSLFFIKLLQGDLESALIQGADFVANTQDREGHKRKELPGAYGMLYGIVLLVAGGSKNLTMAATFMRSGIKMLQGSPENANPFRSFAQICLLFINHKLGKKSTTKDEIYATYKSYFHNYFLTAVFNWFGKPLGDTYIPIDLSEKEEFEYRASGLKGPNDTAAYCDLRMKQLQEKFKSTPLAQIYKAEEVWEDVLSILATELSKSKSSSEDSKTPQKRLLWLVNPLDCYSLECLEQSHKRSGWSKGKKRSILRMLNAVPEFSSKEDRRVISCLQKHSYYNELEIRNFDKLLLALADHPEVYTISEPHLPISIRVQEVQIKIDKSNQGAIIKLNPSSPLQRVEKETSTSFIYTSWSPKALQIFNVLKDSGLTEIAIPKSGMTKAKPVIDRLNEVMPVAGNFAKSSAKKKKSANIPVIQLTPVDDRLHVQLLIEVLNGEEARYIPGVGSTEVLVKSAKNELFNVVRNRTLEKSILMELAERVDWLQEMKSSSAQLFIDNDEDILDFLADVKEHAPEVKVIWPKGERLRVAKVVGHGDFSISVNKSQDWFAVDGEVEVSPKLKLTVQQLLDKSNGGALKYIQLDDKTYLSIRTDLQKRLAALDAVSHTKGKKLLVHPLGASGVEDFIDGAEQVKTDKEWKQHLDKIELQKKYKPTAADNLQAELRPYQEDGVLWLDRLRHWGVGACLADDMGLGKTIQGISILLKYATSGASLVIAPSSVCANWMKELQRFAPTLNPVELKVQNREETLQSLKAYDILVVSYGLIQSNPDLLDKISWNTIVLDEAHAIKNSKSVRSRAVMKLNAQFRLITTGTPIQNHLGELWNLFQFINPGMLGSSDQFTKKYVQNDTSDKSKQMRKALNRYIAPYILRRNKNDVLDDLPEKTEITLHVTLSEQERAMYEVLREKAIEQIDEGEALGAKHLQILAEITKLRQMSCHPQLVAPGSKIPSSKLEAFESLVDDLINAGHKALVFSQFTKHLGLIRQLLDKRGITYQYLDGSTPIKQRALAIDNFQRGQSDLFLISLKAGGVGLNLTAADYVIHMDPWWNPAVEDQASDRAHRIGQKRPVTIYRIIAEDTIEEKIVKMHHNKRDLADKLLANTDHSAKISSEELFNLIRESH